ncbi:unnamed protein product [Didymodactylos carnosus]|uniref:RDRP C-terminal head domain-containing protein n=1 Tax=Didymodactylos carnosus TaxID=1234261 RepID=A0A815I060_9BILA|nr:unnamed protein product [Didymodactylos carnosus]CAF4239233.1 unnamed protein product [Didymodactylos carnosus]
MEFNKGLNSNCDDNNDNCRMAKASACYYVCYKEAGRSVKDKSQMIISFPWIFTPLLLQIKNSMSTIRFSIDVKIKYKVRIRFFTLTNDAIVQLKHYYIMGTKAHIIVPQDHIIFIQIVHNMLHAQNVFGVKRNEDGTKSFINEMIWNKLIIRYLISYSLRNEMLLTSSNIMTNNDNAHLWHLQWMCTADEEECTTIVYNNSMKTMYLELINMCLNSITDDDNKIEMTYLCEYLLNGLITMEIGKRIQ